MGKLAYRLAAAAAPALAFDDGEGRPLMVEDFVSLEAFGRADVIAGWTVARL